MEPCDNAHASWRHAAHAFLALPAIRKQRLRTGDKRPLLVYLCCWCGQWHLAPQDELPHPGRRRELFRGGEG
jgi:hypothetical protein